MYQPITLTKQHLCEDIYGVSIAKKLIVLESQLHWLKIAEDGIVEFYLDNQMMQSFRACEAYFVEAYIRKYGSNNPVWFLSLGSAVHKMIEMYYLHRRDSNFIMENWAISYGSKVWHALNMDQFKDRKEYQDLGGFPGFSTLLIQYANHFRFDNERFRVIGAELYFGKHKEVPLLSLPNEILTGATKFRLYLSGKIDLLIDDGESICPMDHKTSKDFRGQNPMISYELQDGMTGYIYAARKIIEKYNKTNASMHNLVNYIDRKPTNKIWMNFLQIKTVKGDISERFKRAPLFKTDQQLEDYRIRQIRTVQNIFSLITSTSIDNLKPAYNTMMCNNWMHQQCPFHQVHRLGSDNHQLILNSTFVKNEWDPEKPNKEDTEIGGFYEK